jgi:hypothetical protein
MEAKQKQEKEGVRKIAFLPAATSTLLSLAACSLCRRRRLSAPRTLLTRSPYREKT